MMHRNRKPATTGTPWHPAPEVPGLQRAERLRLEMESHLWHVRTQR